MASKSFKGDIIKKYLAKFPTATNHGLARKIYEENPDIFTNKEGVRSLLKAHRGAANGSKKQKDPLQNEFYKKGDERNFQLPESYAEDFTPFEINQSKTLVLSDLHIPYHDNKAIELAIDYGVQHGANCVLINGDLIDFYPISRFEKDPRQRSVKQEFEATRQFFDYLKSRLPNARIVYKTGNHCDRWEKWLTVKAPELLDMDEFQLEIILQLDKYKAQIVKHKRPIKIGKLTLLHGHEIFGTGGVNPARSAFLKTLESVAVSHYHRSSQYVEPTMYGKVFSAVSFGCLCGLNPNFMPINKWSHGFGFVELDIKTKNYVLHNLQIIEGKIFR